MPASTSILDDKAFYGETLGSHAGHKLNLVTRDYYDSYAVVFVHEYGIDCDMYEGCGAMILDNIKTREEALEIMETIQTAGKAEPTFTRAKGGTAECEEPINGITVPDLWHLAQALEDGNLTRNKTILAKAAEEVLECWHLAHDMKRHIQSNG
jgi:hypothetical protein